MPRGKHGQLPKRAGCASPYRGVTRAVNRTGTQTWRAQIRHQGTRYSLGTFSFDKNGEIDAARAYDEAARRLYGDEAQTNF